jgi:hypothetical protein
MTTTLYAATRKGLFAFVADGAAWRLKIAISSAIR